MLKTLSFSKPYYDFQSCLLTNTIEGSWDEVMRIIGQAHTLVHQNGVLRVQTDIRAGTRYLSIASAYSLRS